MKSISAIALAALLVLGCQKQQTPQEQAQEQPQANLEQATQVDIKDSDSRVTIGSDTVKAGESGKISVSFYAVEDAKALVVPLQFSDMIMPDSCEWGPLGAKYGTKLCKVDDTLYTMMMTIIPVQEPVIPVGEGIVGWMHFTVSADAKPVTFAVKNCFVPPASHLSYVDANDPPQLMRPMFDAGSIVIQ